MCSIGWLKLKDSWILFKNRDRRAGEKKENFFVQKENYVGFADKKYKGKGLWIGMNKYGIGIASAYGPAKEIVKGLKPENFEANEEVLRKCKTVEEARKKYIELAKQLGRSFNVIIADSKQAIALELFTKEKSEESFDKIAAKTNHFTKLKKYNIKNERNERAEARLKKLMELIPNVKGGRDMIDVLGFHSKDNDYESICRHEDSSETVASAIFEVFKDKVKVYYILNDFPHTKKFQEKIISFK